MKFCNMPFRQLHIEPGGNCRVCGWTDGAVGNLLVESIEDIWNGEKIQRVRNSIKSGTYEFCRAVSCPYLENDSLPDIPEEEIFKIVPSEQPVSFSVACDFICNHSCPSCRHEVFIPSNDYRDKLEQIMSSIMPALKNAQKITTCGNGDAFFSPYIMRMLENLHPDNPNCTIEIETNGSLFDNKHWEKVSHLGKYNLRVVVTPNSFKKETFRYLNGGHDTYDKVMSNLAFIRDLKHDGDVNYYEISIVVQERNFSELPEFARRCLEEFDVDRVVVKPLYRWFKMTPEEYWYKDVLNPSHPYHKEYLEMLKSPVLEDPRVYFWGGQNVHEDSPHPAYIYKEYMQLTNRLICGDGAEYLERCLKNKDITKAYIYGDTELALVLANVLGRTDIEFKGFMSQNAGENTLCKDNAISFCDYVIDNSDSIIITNYTFFERIERDFRVNGFTGHIVSAKELLE